MHSLTSERKSLNRGASAAEAHSISNRAEGLAALCSSCFGGGDEAACNVLGQLVARVNEIWEQLTRLEQKFRPSETNMQLELLSVAQAAKLLNRSRYTIRQHCAHGRITAERSRHSRGPYGEWRLSKEAIREFLEKGPLKPTSRRYSKGKST